jgi:hypothetical protein
MIFMFLGLKRKFSYFRENLFSLFAKNSYENNENFRETKIEAKIFAKTKISTNTYAKIFLFGIIIF